VSTLLSHTRRERSSCDETSRDARRRARDRRLAAALAVSLLGCAGAVAATLAGSPLTLARVSTAGHEPIGTATQKVAACQADETLPRRTSAIRLRVFAFVGPKVTVDVVAHGQVIAHGERGAGWTAGVVTVPVRALASTRSGVQVCFTLLLNGDETAELVGEIASPELSAQSADGPLHGRLRIEYLRPGSASWWSQALQVARRMGLGHAWSGTWIVGLLIVLMAAVAALCSRLIARGLE